MHMTIYSLTELIEKDHLIIQARPGIQAELIEYLKKVDLSFEGAKGWVAEGEVGSVTIRPNYVGDKSLTIYVNPQNSKIKGSTPEDAEKKRQDFLIRHGFSIDELLMVEEEMVEHTESGTRVHYIVPVKDNTYNNIYALTVQTFYEPIKT